VDLPLIVHATQLERAKEALRAGANVLVHSVAPEAIDDAFIALAKQRSTIVIPTLTVYEGYADLFAGRSPAARYPLDCVDAATRTKLERVLPEAQRARGLQGLVRSGRADTLYASTARNVRRLRDAGIPIAMGTDAGNPGTAHGPSVYREMEALQSAGMSAAEVFASATIVAARAMGRSSEVGSLDAGKLADLIVLDADPFADIANVRRLRFVMKGGALYGRSELLPRR
jgi:imidazolonepropionase-like amidohydrolase